MGIVDNAIQSQQSFPKYYGEVSSKIHEIIKSELMPYAQRGIVRLDFNPPWLAVVYIIEGWKSTSGYKKERACYFELRVTNGNSLENHSHRVWMELQSNDGGASQTYFSLEEGLATIGKCISSIL